MPVTDALYHPFPILVREDDWYEEVPFAPDPTIAQDAVSIIMATDDEFSQQKASWTYLLVPAFR